MKRLLRFALLAATLATANCFVQAKQAATKGEKPCSLPPHV
jgi:hypothetical protein